MESDCRNPIAVIRNTNGIFAISLVGMDVLKDIKKLSKKEALSVLKQYEEVAGPARLSPVVLGLY